MVRQKLAKFWIKLILEGSSPFFSIRCKKKKVREKERKGKRKKEEKEG